MDKNQVLQALQRVMDPDLNRDIVSLGMVREIRVEGTDIFVQVAVVSGTDRLREIIRLSALEYLKQIPGAGKVQVEVIQGDRQGRHAMPQHPLPGIRNILAVSSGKGGVGKTTVSVNLAYALKQLGFRVGLMDGDIYGPNVPLMVGVASSVRPEINEMEKMIPIDAEGIRMISIGILVPENEPMVWRGPMLHGVITQFLQKVAWGELDFLVVDLPPGTGDVQLSLAQTVPLTGAVMVTTPQQVSLMDVRKGIAMFEKTKVPVLGIVENMTGDIFGSGGGRKLAEQLNLPFLGEIPLEAEIRKSGDAGRPMVLAHPESKISQSFLQCAKTLLEVLEKSRDLGAEVS